MDFCGAGATADFQYEGGWQEGGRGLSTHDFETDGSVQDPRGNTLLLADGRLCKGTQQLFFGRELPGRFKAPHLPGLLLPQPQCCGRLPPHEGRCGADGRHGLQCVPLLHLLEPHLPHRRRAAAQRRGPQVLSGPHRRAGKAWHGAAHHHPPRRAARRSGRKVQRLGEPPHHRMLSALLPYPV